MQENKKNIRTITLSFFKFFAFNPNLLEKMENLLLERVL